jgi:hypothetical protein
MKQIVERFKGIKFTVEEAMQQLLTGLANLENV